MTTSSGWTLTSVWLLTSQFGRAHTRTQSQLAPFRLHLFLIPETKKEKKNESTFHSSVFVRYWRCWRWKYFRLLQIDLQSCLFRPYCGIRSNRNYNNPRMSMFVCNRTYISLFFLFVRPPFSSFWGESKWNERCYSAVGTDRAGQRTQLRAIIYHYNFTLSSSTSSSSKSSWIWIALLLFIVVRCGLLVPLPWAHVFRFCFGNWKCYAMAYEFGNGNC